MITLTEDQRAQMMFTGVAGFRNTEVLLRWQRSAIFTAANTAGLPLLLAFGATPATNRLVGIFAILICFFWAGIHYKTQQYIEHWESVLAALEPAEVMLGVARVFTGSSWKSANRWPNFYQLLYALPVTFVIVWVIVIFTHL